MVTKDQAVEIASRLVQARMGRECPLLGVHKLAGEAIGGAQNTMYWMVSFEFEPGFDPALLVSVNASTGEAVQEKLL